MIAGFWTFPLKPDSHENFQQYFKQKVYGLVARAPGFKRLGYYYDSNTNQVITVLEWESEEDAANARNDPNFPAVMVGLAAYLTGAPNRVVYEMVQDAWTPAPILAG